MEDNLCLSSGFFQLKKNNFNVYLPRRIQFTFAVFPNFSRATLLYCESKKVPDPLKVLNDSKLILN